MSNNTNTNTNKSLSLAERDKYLYQIEKQLEAKKKLLIKKNKQLNKNLKQNEFLEAAKAEYNQYFDRVIKETTDEYTALKQIADHLQNIIDYSIKHEKMDKDELAAAKAEHKQILVEVNKVKHILNTIVK